MGIIELISAILLILSCIFIIIIVFFQGANKGGMSQSITGQSESNYYQKNMGRSKEMKMKKMTVAAAVLFFLVAMGVNIVAVHFPDGFGGNASDSSQEEQIGEPTPPTPDEG
jgi:protein translocase SecG subunit